ncbi:T9SS type A sorting domain-containing protein [candidate division WOR-3 bacterium]|nr:T9SS type A sorting domain-containing protein [candidate division WOR-3 bacterium]
MTQFNRIIICFQIICYVHVFAQRIDSLTDWTINSIPVITPQDSSPWIRWKTDPCVVIDESEWFMFFGANDSGVSTQIGRAVSSDGKNWIPDTMQIMVSLGPAGAWDDAEVETPFVLIDESAPASQRYKMWYAGKGNAGNNRPDFAYQIGYAYSSDGINWIKYDNPANNSDPRFAESDPVLPIPEFIAAGEDTIPETISYDSWSTAEPSVVFEDGVFKLYYLGLGLVDDVFAHWVALATSTNGYQWQRDSIVFSPNFKGKEATGIACPAVIKQNNEYLLFYSMVELPYDSFANVERGTIGLAKSLDGFDFTRVSSNPILTHGPSGSYYESGLFAPSPLVKNDSLYLYFSSLVYKPIDAIFEPFIGCAKAPLSSSFIEHVKNPVDFSFELMQNSPNPFTSVTMIAYELPGLRYVDLSVFNLAGQKIRTLVSEQQCAGSYSVKWNGKDEKGNEAPSGIYFYCIESSRLRYTRKMTLLR